MLLTGPELYTGSAQTYHAGLRCEYSRSKTESTKTMNIMTRFLGTAKARDGRVVLPEGNDPRIVAAAKRMVDDGVAEPILLGTPEAVNAAADAAGVELNGIRVIDPAESEQLDEYTDAYVANRDLNPRVARRMVKRPLYHGGMMVAMGHADTMVAGVATPTALVIQAGAMTVGLAEGIATPSSFFLMIVPHFQERSNRVFLYADCAVNIAPTSDELADIAMASQCSACRLLDEAPRVAMLSFSTQGSASHTCVDRVRQAMTIVKQRDPALQIDGEFQADAAIIPAVAAKKVKQASSVAGQANVLIFPDLNSGNIAYKLTQYMANAQAIGPFLQGFAKPISDLSRGASVDDIIATTAVCLTQID